MGFNAALGFFCLWMVSHFSSPSLPFASSRASDFVAHPISSQPAPFTADTSFLQGVLCLIYLVCSLRTNIAFVIIFFTLVLAFGLLTGTYFYNAQGKTALAGRLLVAAGACAFVTCVSGWWIFLGLMLAAVDFPIQLPVGDLSRFIKGASDRRKMNRDEEAMAT